MGKPEVSGSGGKIDANSTCNHSADASLFVARMEHGLVGCKLQETGVLEQGEAGFLRLLGKPSALENAAFGIGSVHG
jgi:hypothetical protein